MQFKRIPHITSHLTGGNVQTSGKLKLLFFFPLSSIHAVTDAVGCIVPKHPLPVCPSPTIN